MKQGVKPETPLSSPQPGKRKFLADAVCIVLLLALCLPIGLSRFDVQIDLGDEGFLAHGAVRVMEGQVPHRDFVSVQPPLGFYTAAAMFKLLGTSLETLRFLGLGIYLAIPLLIYTIARNLAGPVLSLAAAAPAAMLGISFFNFVPYSVWQGITASLCAAALFLYAGMIGQNSLRRCCLALPAGVLGAVSMLLRHDQGLYLAMSIAAYIVALKWTKGSDESASSWKLLGGLWLCGMVLVFLPFGIYWLAVGALPEMFNQLVVFPMSMYAKTSSLPFPRFASAQSLVYNAAVSLYYLPPVVVGMAALWLAAQAVRKRFGVPEAKLAFVTLWCALYYCQSLARSDLCHLLIALPPFFVLCAWCWREVSASLECAAAKRIKSRFAPVLLSTLASCCAAAFVVGYLLTLKLVLLPPVQAGKMVALARAGVRIPDAADLESIVQCVQSLAPEDRSILCLPYQPMYYFLCERRNPTRWNCLWPGDQTLEDHQDLIRQARKDPPAVVVITDESALSCYAPAILDYVHREYRRYAEAGALTVYLPK
jgi:hypothetical protein